MIYDLRFTAYDGRSGELQHRADAGYDCIQSDAVVPAFRDDITDELSKKFTGF